MSDAFGRPFLTRSITLMNPSIKKLYNFLKLEVEHGYDNRAIIGGLDKMLGLWQAEARLNNLSEVLIQLVASRLQDYHRLTPQGRADAVQGLWKRIQREAGDDVPALPVRLPSEKKVEKAAVAPKRAPRPLVTEAKPAGAPGETLPAELPAEPPVERRADVERPTLQPRPATAADVTPAALQAQVTVLAGVGPRHGQTLARLGLHTLGDMLYFFPRRYDDYSTLKPISRLEYGEEVTIIGKAESVVTRRIHSGQRQLVEAVVSDGSGTLRVTWWNPYVAKRVRSGMYVVLSGKIDQYLGRLVMVNPEVEPMEQENLHTNRIVPVYPLTANITQRWLRSRMYEVVSHWAPRVQDPLPESLRRAFEVMDLPSALLQAHFPDTHAQLAAARHRLAFDEIFLLQLGVLRQKRQWQARRARIFATSDEWLQAAVARLPFPLTGAQQRALADVRADLASGRPMNRLLQGDVGSGKTVIAALAVAMITHHGGQAAIMAPTSILAEQHYKTLSKLLAETLPAESIRLMVGATPESEKGVIRDGLAQGKIQLVIGTHALLEEPVTFANLQLAVIDEQHRFGVEQRALLRSKGDNPHLLVMTATPIPRSLALTVYGDLDLSVIDEMPPGRQPVQTVVLFPSERERAYQKICREIEKGYRAFIIYPLVEESENSDKAAVEEHARLQKTIFPQYRLGLLHGRMKADEKEAVMLDFRDGRLDILVSTSVVEVGVDVPEATVMLIEGANRFGLAQLHQFRGRVGRGTAQSYCILIPEQPDETENQRLMAMAETNDGFVLAERDLQQRGPGDFLGTRQAGFSELKLASLSDVRLIEKARKAAQTLFERDPELSLPEHGGLAAALQRFWAGAVTDIS